VVFAPLVPSGPPLLCYSDGIDPYRDGPLIDFCVRLAENALASAQISAFPRPRRRETGG